MSRGSVCVQPRVLEGSGADDHVRGALLEQLLHELARAHAATDLDRDIAVRDQHVDDGEIRSAPRGGVEVYHMEALEAVVFPRARHLHRILEPHLLLRERAAYELHARAVAKIHCWNGNHLKSPERRASPRKACRKRTPADELFSG
jgi:hypothetical protein